MSDYRYAVDPAFDDNSEWVKCDTCKREYDRKEYNSDTCVECENELTIKERGQVMKCLECNVNMASEGYIQDNLQVCHSCYPKLFGEGEGE